jgi:hypothetical protein
MWTRIRTAGDRGANHHADENDTDAGDQIAVGQQNLRSPDQIYKWESLALAMTFQKR